MHPLIAASLSTQLARPHRRLHSRRHPTPGHRRTRPRSSPPSSSSARARGPTRRAPVRFGALDGNRSAGAAPGRAAPHHEVLVAEVDGSIEAALALDGGLAVSDPFRPSAPDAKLLAIRARQLGGDATARAAAPPRRAAPPHVVTSPGGAAARPVRPARPPDGRVARAADRAAAPQRRPLRRPVHAPHRVDRRADGARLRPRRRSGTVFTAPPDVLRGGESSSFLEPFVGPQLDPASSTAPSTCASAS